MVFFTWTASGDPLDKRHSHSRCEIDEQTRCGVRGGKFGSRRKTGARNNARSVADSGDRLAAAADERTDPGRDARSPTCPPASHVKIQTLEYLSLRVKHRLETARCFLQKLRSHEPAPRRGYVVQRRGLRDVRANGSKPRRYDLAVRVVLRFGR